MKLYCVLWVSVLSLCAWTFFTPVDQSIRDRPEVRHAMELYRAGHTNCEFGGEIKGLEVHHISPLWLNPSLAADPSSMIMLCKKHHLYLGHNGNFGKYAVTNIREICAMRVIVERSAK